MPFCDGCGAQASDSHIRERIERLELVTRFRPIHIHALFIDAAPPVRPQDYFYRAASDRSERSAGSRKYFDELAKCASFTPSDKIIEETVLAEFQRRGFFLAHAVECPVESPEKLSAVLSGLGPTVVQRVERSYKPKYVAPISQEMEKLIPLFQSSGWAERLVLNEGGPFIAPLPGDRNSRPEIEASLGDALTNALSRRP